MRQKEMKQVRAASVPDLTPRTAFCLAALYQLLLASTAAAALGMYGQGPFWDQARGVLRNWDARWYLEIALRGYHSESNGHLIAFFPLYPLLVRFAGGLLPSLEAAALLVTTAASIVGHALFLLFLQRIGFDRNKALRVSLLLCLAPAAIYFTLAYTEALFLAETAAFLYVLERRRYGAAAVLGLCASLTRLMGVLLIIPYAYSLLTRRRELLQPARQAALGLLIPFGFFVYLALNYWVYGDPFHFQVVQRAVWFKTPVNPFMQSWQHVGQILRIPPSFDTRYIDVLCTHLIVPLLLLYLLVAARKRPRLSFGLILWAGAQWAVIASQSFWLSSARYACLILPLYVVLEEFSWPARVPYLILIVLMAAALIPTFYIAATGGWLY